MIKNILSKVIPGIALVAVAVLAFCFGNASASAQAPARQAAQSVTVAQPQPMQPAVTDQAAPTTDSTRSPQAAASQGEAAPRVVYVVVREADVIRYAPAYYGPQYYNAEPLCTDPFTEIRVNPIPWPVNYCTPSLFGPVREFRRGRNVRR